MAESTWCAKIIITGLIKTGSEIFCRLWIEKVAGLTRQSPREVFIIDDDGHHILIGFITGVEMRNLDV